MKKICCFVIMILLVLSLISAASAAGYTLPEKMQRQLEVGSGLKGTFTIHGNADAEMNPLIHSLQNAEFEIRGIQYEGNKHYYIYQQGENEAMDALTEYCTVGSEQYLRSDFLKEKSYLLPDLDHLINRWLKSEGENPSVFPDLLRSVIGNSEQDELSTDTLERQLEMWISAFSAESAVQSGDGSPRLSQSFRIPVEELYSTATELIRTISSSETYMGYFREILSKEQIDTYLNPELGYYYVDAMKQLDMEGEILFTRTVSTLGELIQSSLVLPMDPEKTGYVSVTLENNETRKSIFFTGPRGMLYLELPMNFDPKADDFENEMFRFALVDNENEEAKNVALRITASKKIEKYENTEEGKVHEKEEYLLRIVRDTDGLPEAVTEDLIPQMAETEAEILVHYYSKPQLSSPTTLELSCRIIQGEYNFDFEGTVKTASPWIYSPFSVEGAVSAADYEKEDFDLMKEEWIRSAEEKLARIPEEIKQSDDETEPAGVDEIPAEKENEENAEPAEEPDETEEVQPFDLTETNENVDPSESNHENEPIG